MVEWEISHRLRYLKSYFPVGGAIWEYYGTFSTWRLPEGSSALGMGFESL